MPYPEMGHSIHDRVVYRREGTGYACLTDALGSKRVVRGRRDGVSGLDERKISRTRKAVIDETCCQAVASVVVAHFLEQGVGRPGEDPAMHLPFGQHRIDNLAAVVDGHDSQELDEP